MSIDYGMGRTNIDHATGIRYGVISQHDVLQAWADSSEADYGEPTCPKCGNTVVDSSEGSAASDTYEQYRHGCYDFVCERCKLALDSSDVFGDEPRGYSYNGDGYECVACLDSGVMILKSPFYTFADFCSPCVLGAGNLNSTGENGVKTYCFGHDWFESGKAPYRVWSVETGEEIAA